MNKIIQIIASDKVICSMRKLYPKWELKSKLVEFYISKIKLCFLILLVGIFIYFLTMISSKNEIINNSKIQRNDYEKGNKKVEVTVSSKEDFYSEDIELDISEKRYSDEAIKELSDNAIVELENIILAGNESLNHVTTNLNFVNKIDGYPFDISYRTDKPLILSRDGEINSEKLEEAIMKMTDESENEEGNLNRKKNIKGSVIVEIIVTFSYKDYKEENEFYTCIYEKELNDKEKFEKGLKEALNESDVETIRDDYFYLPEEINGEKITFSEKGDYTKNIILVLTFLTMTLVFILKDKDLENEVEKRNKELLLEYPRLLNKFTLFYNAGMPIKLIWNKICEDYLTEYEANNRNYLYEEMLITRAQIQDGKREIDAYEEFANRIGLPCYRVFISLLEQAIQMGKKDLIYSLRRESEEAFINRKNNAKQLFEEAGTKLLIPMFMMLCVVIVIIMFPAFYSFNM